MSGASERLGSRKRSKSRSYSSGSTWLSLQDVADEGAARRAAGAGGNAVLDGEAHEVADDEEVAGEAHPADDAQLVFEPVLDRPARRVAVALAQPFVAEFAQVIFRLLVVRRREDGEVALLEVELDVDSRRRSPGCVARPLA